MPMLRAPPSPSPPPDTKFVWEREFFYLDLNNQEVEFRLTMLRSKRTKLGFIRLNFYRQGVGISVPPGIIMANNDTRVGTPYKLFAPTPGAPSMTVPLDEGFKVLYLGRIMASAPPNIEIMYHITQHNFLPLIYN